MLRCEARGGEARKQGWRAGGALQDRSRFQGQAPAVYPIRHCGRIGGREVPTSTSLPAEDPGEQAE